MNLREAIEAANLERDRIKRTPICANGRHHLVYCTDHQRVECYRCARPIAKQG